MLGGGTDREGNPCEAPLTFFSFFHFFCLFFPLLFVDHLLHDFLEKELTSFELDVALRKEYNQCLSVLEGFSLEQLDQHIKK